jgi:hypothetical protein
VDELNNDNDNDNDSEEGSDNGAPKVDDHDNEDGTPDSEGSSDNEDGAPDSEGSSDNEDGTSDDEDSSNDDDAAGADEPAGTPGVDGTTPGVGAEHGGTPGVGDDDEVAGMDATYGTRNHSHDLRPRKPRDYSHLHADLEHTVMTQYNVKKGLKIFGQAGADAVVEEMKQLHDRAVIQPRLANMLTREEKRNSLQYLMFLKQKRCGRIKGRGCADGRKQRIYKTKEETSAPTVSVESLFLSCVIDAKERQKVVTCDIPHSCRRTSTK